MGSNVCVHCETSYAEPTFEKCEKCMMKEAAPEVRWLLWSSRNTDQYLMGRIDNLIAEIEELRKGAK